MAEYEPNVVKLKKTRNEFHKLTQRNVSKFRPRKDSWHVRDTELKGFWLKIAPTGRRTYGVHGKIGSSRKNSNKTIGTLSQYTCPEAREVARDWLKGLSLGVSPAEAIAETTARTLNNPTLEYIHELYMDSRDLRPKTRRDYENVWRQDWVAKIGRRPIRELTASELSTWFNSNKRMKPRQTQKAYTMIGASFKYALALGEVEINIMEANVKALVQQITYEPKDTSLSIEKELPAFLKALQQLSVDKRINPTHRDWQLFTLLYGLRISEASQLEWSMIDMEERSFTLPARITKTKQKLKLPLTWLAQTMLISRWHKEDKHDQWVFQNRYSTGYVKDERRSRAKIIELVREDLKDPEFRTSPHDWRSTFLNVHISMGTPQDERERLMNHSKKKNIQQVYARDVLAVQRKILENYNSKLMPEGELYMLYVDDEGVDKRLIMESLYSPSPPQEFSTKSKDSKDDMFDDFAKQHEKESKKKKMGDIN